MSKKFNRRSFLLGMASTFLAAPAIVRTSSLMPVEPIRSTFFDLEYERFLASEYAPWATKWEKETWAT